MAPLRPLLPRRAPGRAPPCGARSPRSSPPPQRARQQAFLDLLGRAAGGTVVWHAGSRRRPVASVAGLRPLPSQHGCALQRETGGGDYVHGAEIPPAAVRRLVPGLAGNGGRIAHGHGAASSRHARLDAIAALAGRLGLAPDDPFLLRPGAG